MSANQQDNKTVAAKQPNIGYLNEKWETPRIGLLGPKTTVPAYLENFAD